MSKEYSTSVRMHVMKAYARVGKVTDPEAQTKMKILVEDILERNIPLPILVSCLNKHAEKSHFAPVMADISSNMPNESQREEYGFLERFRNQATSPYAFTEIDDDVYTVKKHIGARRVEQATSEDWQWVEKQALAVFRDLRENRIELIENPNKTRVKVLESGARMLPKSEMTALNELEAIKTLLDSKMRKAG